MWTKKLQLHLTRESRVQSIPDDICGWLRIVLTANKALEKKVSAGEELKARLEAELREKIKKMEKEFENATMKAAGKHCCKKM